MILLSFDTEEFDLPKEYGANIDLDESINVSVEGTEQILDLLKTKNVKATFFCTSTFARNALSTFKRIINEGHEVASHGCNHTSPQKQDIYKSKLELEALVKQPVNGYRQPRMFAVDDEEISKSGYNYNSSLHPAFIPGRYMHLNQPRTPFLRGNVLEIPMSVTPGLRLPVFWLACHNYPLSLYLKLCNWTWNHDGQFVIYFHPWEFIDLGRKKEWKIPYIIKRNSGSNMMYRLGRLIDMFKSQHANFVTYSEFTNNYKLNCQ